MERNSAQAKQRRRARRARNMKKKPLPKLGVIRLDDYIYPPAKGDTDHPGSFDYKVVYHVVPGLDFETCKLGTLDQQTEDNFYEGIRKLTEDHGCSAITGDCGFMMWMQEKARNMTDVPVFMSSLVLLPSVTSALGLTEVIILTANAEKLKPMTELLKKECGIDVEDDPNFHIVGCGGVPGFEAVENGTAVDVAKVTPGIVALAKESLAKYPNSSAFLLECTELPAYSDSIRNETGLPVFDAISCADFYLTSFKDNPNFGIDHWQKKGRRIKKKKWSDDQIEEAIGGDPANGRSKL